MQQLITKPSAHEPLYKRRWVRRTGLLVLLLFLAFGLYRAIRPDPNLKKIKQLRQEFTSAEAKNWSPEQRQEKGKQMREAMAKLSTSQREELAAERQKRFEDDLKRYAAMSPGEKVRHLDDIIDRSEKMRKEFAQRNPNGQRPPGTGPGTFAAGGPGSRPGQSLSHEEREKRRKERLNRTTPEFRTLMDQFRRDMENRRKQRGLPAGGGIPRR
jgi:hypothetical protein